MNGLTNNPSRGGDLPCENNSKSDKIKKLELTNREEKMSTTATGTTIEAAPPATKNRWNKPGARWKDVIRPYTKEEVERLRGTVKIEYTLARLGADRLW